MAVESLPGEMELVRAARGGDSAAFGELIDLHAAQVVNLLARVLGDREEALDLAQETFLRAFQKLWRFDPERSFRVWIAAIAWNLALDNLRRRKRRVQPGGLAGYGEGSAVEDPPDRSWEPPLRGLERREESELVHRALALLSPPHRLALALRELEGLSYQEVAETLGVRLGTAKSRINRARLEFRDVYRRLAPES
jgi:RNA polymerase sigma-70 factor (ECF subfamily)